ncbi:MAG: hypothetical protein WCF23_10595, partial [Candidatus Nitrosopolaris sp.]
MSWLSFKSISADLVAGQKLTHIRISVLSYSKGKSMGTDVHDANAVDVPSDNELSDDEPVVDPESL